MRLSILLIVLLMSISTALCGELKVGLLGGDQNIKPFFATGENAKFETKAVFVGLKIDLGDTFFVEGELISGITNACVDNECLLYSNNVSGKVAIGLKLSK